MAGHRLGEFFRAVLPPGYERMRREMPALQHFLEQNLPEPLNRNVTLLRLDASEIVIAAHSPPVANFLRLHTAEIRQQLREAFGYEQALRFKTLPASMLRVGADVKIPAPRLPDADSAEAIERSAACVEDEDLRAALQSLADSLRSGQAE